MKIQMFDKDGNPLGEFEGEIWFEAENPLTVEHALNFTWPVDKSENMTVAATWEAEVTFEIEDPFIHLMAFCTDAALDEDLGLTQEEYFGMLIASTFMERVSNKIRRVGDDDNQ